MLRVSSLIYSFFKASFKLIMSETEKKASLKSGKKVIFIFPLALLVCVAVYGFFFWADEDSVVTEDAYVEGNIVQVTSQVSGTITSINADNTDAVKKGDILVNINPTDASIALDKASAELASSLRKARNQLANLDELRAAIVVKQEDYNKASADYRRRSGLSTNYAISAEEMNHAGDALRSAKASLEVANRQYEAAETLVKNTTPETQPDVLSAKTAVRQAWVDLHRTRVLAPVGGFIAQRSAQVGQHVSAGSAMMSVIPLESVWVTANFKETQVGRLSRGQSVTLTSDIYGDKHIYHGKVLGIEPGTGRAFSLLPAQNATGNWIKVVQRIPVRIELNEEELKKAPLRLGLSMHVSVDLTRRSKNSLESLTDHQRQVWTTPVYADEDQKAAEHIQEIISHNE